MSNPVKVIEIKGKDKIYKNFRLKTKSLPLFNQYHEMFYIFNSELNKFIKIIPVNILELLDPIVLSYLIMTDGNFDRGRNRVRIYTNSYTNSYTKEEVQNLANAINTKFGIYVGVLHDRNDQWILTIGAKQLNLLRNTVKSHFHPSILYRLGI
jgi:LAGLIDADG DNA endonuclease family protein